MYPALPNLGAILQRSDHKLPTLVFSSNYPAHLIYSVVNFVEKLSKWSSESEKVVGQVTLCSHLIFNKSLQQYLEHVCHRLNNHIQTNWFIKVEVLLLLNLIKSTQWNLNLIPTPTVLQLSFHLLNSISHELIMEIVFVFDKVAFNQRYFSQTILADDDTDKLNCRLQRWKVLYSEAVLSSLTTSQVSWFSWFIFFLCQPTKNKKKMENATKNDFLKGSIFCYNRFVIRLVALSFLLLFV